jgi:hypothetical protein
LCSREASPRREEFDGRGGLAICRHEEVAVLRDKAGKHRAVDMFREGIPSWYISKKSTDNGSTNGSDCKPELVRNGVCTR